MKIVILPVGVVQLSPQQKFMILVVKDVENIVIHTMGTWTMYRSKEEILSNIYYYLPTPVLLNLHAKMVDATILPLLVVDVV